jgi:hypothetical protein
MKKTISSYNMLSPVRFCTQDIVCKHAILCYVLTFVNKLLNLLRIFDRLHKEISPESNLLKMLLFNEIMINLTSEFASM